MTTLTLQDVDRKFMELFKVEPHKEKQDNPIDGGCLQAQDGKLEVIRADLDLPKK